MKHAHGYYVPTNTALAKYNIAREKYDQRFHDQGGLCAICARHPIAAIDHCHLTGEFRGLLCIRCNMGLGFFQDDEQSLYNAMEYLHRFAVASDGREEEEQEYYDSGVPRQPDGWIKDSPWPLFGYTLKFGQDETGAWIDIKRAGQTVAGINVLVPPQPRAKAEIWVRRKFRNEFPVRDTGTYD